MEAVLLDLVLAGAIDKEQIAAWMLGENASNELPMSAALKLTASEAALLPGSRPFPSTFRAAILNTVRCLPRLYLQKQAAL